MAIAAGAAFGVIVTLSPLLPIAVAVAAGVVVYARRGLPEEERRAVTTVVGAAIALRVLFVIGLAVWSIPLTSAQSGGVLLGDETYLFERSIRTRHVVLDLPVTKQDYMMMFEEYANTKYTWWLAWMQTMFGPSPFMLRIVNGLLFVAASCVMYRVTRRGFGASAALVGLGVLLFLPSLLISSVSLLKESAFFLLTAGALTTLLMALRGRRVLLQIGGVAAFLVMLWGLSDLRPAAVILTAGGFAAGILLRMFLGRRGLVVAVAVTAALAVGAVLISEPASRPVREALTLLSRQHMGHATMRGHSYHTLDARFYPDWYTALGGKPLSLGESARYVARSAWTFVTVPLPWQTETPTELVFMPEQIAWYVIAVLAVIGLAAAYRRDSLVTALLLGYILAMSAALALTNGNVGTVVRLRGLVTRFVIWIAAVGLLTLLARVVRPKVTT